MTEARINRAGLMLKAATVALAVAVGVVLAMIVIGQAVQLQKLGKIASDTRVGTERLVDCTTPGGKCYEQGRSTTTGAVGSINKVTVATVYCSGKLGPKATIDQLNACVTTLVK
jgi:hypothetical protein